MRESLDQRLMQTRERIRAKRKLDSMLKQARDSLYTDASRCRELQERLDAERSDVEKLEGTSLTGLFYTVLGTKEDRLEEERQEFLAAKLKYEEASESRQLSEAEVQRIEVKLQPLAGIEDEYQKLLSEKEAALAAAGDGTAESLLRLSESLADLTADAKEPQEAIVAGEQALRALRSVRSELKSAANWGTFDMLGGGLLSTMAKHSKIDEAKSQAHRAQRYLRLFEEELADADARLHVSLEIGGFSKFADYFFDGLIADWIVQSKIQNAASACERTITQVTSAISTCRRRLTEAREQQQDVAKQRRTLIEQA